MKYVNYFSNMAVLFMIGIKIGQEYSLKNFDTIFGIVVIVSILIDVMYELTLIFHKKV